MRTVSRSDRLVSIVDIDQIGMSWGTVWRFSYLESRSEGVHETGEEQESTSLEEAGSRHLEVVEDTGYDQSHDEVTNQHAYGQAGVATKSFPSAP